MVHQGSSTACSGKHWSWGTQTSWGLASQRQHLWVDRQGEISEPWFLYDWVSVASLIPSLAYLQPDNSRELSIPFSGTVIFLWYHIKFFQRLIHFIGIRNDIHKLLINHVFWMYLWHNYASLCDRKWIIWKISAHGYANLPNFDEFPHMTPQSTFLKVAHDLMRNVRMYRGLSCSQWQERALPNSSSSWELQFNTDNKCYPLLSLSDKLSFCSFF